LPVFYKPLTVKGGKAMLTFVMLTKLAPTALRSPASFEELESAVMEQIRKKCPQVQWDKNLALLGPYDYLDIFRAPDHDSAMEVCTIIRSFGHATTEIWAATEWDKYKELLHKLPKK
jgi:uncharacterized protein with GYD domain